jgi:hypothetical protein
MVRCILYYQLDSLQSIVEIEMWRVPTALQFPIHALPLVHICIHEWSNDQQMLWVIDCICHNVHWIDNKVPSPAFLVLNNAHRHLDIFNCLTVPPCVQVNRPGQ